MNAKQEFLQVTGGKKVLCAKIVYCPNWDTTVEINLKPEYTEEEYQEFLTNLDFSYDDGYGAQYIHGTIWCDNGAWFDRYDYDGSESWEFHKYPAIPTVWGPVKVVSVDTEPDESDEVVQ